MTVDRQQVEQFLYYEADLMDEHRYDEWLALWTGDALYWVPTGHDELDPKRAISLIYDDRTRLHARIARLKKGFAQAHEPKSRMRRLISNVVLEEEANRDILSRSNFLLVEFHQGQQEVFAGRTIHRLRPYAGSFKLVFKKVLLVNNDESIDTLNFLI